MKSTKMIALLAVSGLLALTPALLAADTNTPPAGGPPGGGMRGRGGPSIEQLTTNLSLTADQIPKVKAVLDEQRQKMGEVFQNQDLSQEDRRAKMKEVRDEMTAKMKDILTPDQFEKWQKEQQNMRNRRPGGPPPGGGNGAPPAGAPPQN
jgi:Spy/CpxP family protein refolding chaperone